MKTNIKVSIVILLFFSFLSCKKEVNNPYSKLIFPDTTQNNTDETLDPTSIAGLHQNIFKKTCANSGCHDGTFEPDYRTIESTYNSLVFQTPIKNTSNNDFEYRVKPFNADNSMLFYRLTVDLGGNSGIMPLQIDKGNDWELTKEKHISDIRAWINSGAKDILGRVNNLPNKEPTLHGVLAFADGNLLSHTSGSPINVPSATKKLELWFSFSDDSTQTTALSFNRVKFSKGRMDDFSNSKDTSLSIVNTPIIGSGYYAGNYNYYHKVIVDSTYFGKKGDVTYLRAYVNDGSHEEATEIPEFGTYVEIKLYASLRIQ